MFFAQQLKDFYSGRKRSEQRRGMGTAIMEGIPATIISNFNTGAILTAYLLYMHASSQQVGIVLGIPPLANVLQIVFAYFMQRMENRKFWMALLGILHRSLWVMTGVIPFLMPNLLRVPVFIVLYLFSFFCASVAGLIWTSIVSDMVPPKVQGRYFGIRNMILWAFASGTLLVGGQILEKSSTSFMGFGILYGICAICTIWNAFELFKYPNPKFDKSMEKSGLRQMLKPLKNLPFLTATIFISIFTLLQNIAVPLFAFVMLHVLMVNYTELTAVTIVQMVVMMVSYYVWGNLNARFNTMSLLLWSLPIIALSCLLWIGLKWIPVLPVLILVQIVLGIGLGGYNLLTFNFIIGDTPKPDRPMYIAVFSALTGLAGFIGPMIGGEVYKLAHTAPFWVRSYGIFFFTGVVLFTMAVGIGPLILRKAKRDRQTNSIMEARL